MENNISKYKREQSSTFLNKQNSNSRNFRFPLLEDLKAQRKTAVIFFFKCTVFSILLLILDWTIASTLRLGLDRYFGLNSPCRVLCIGHSHLVLGVDKMVLEEKLKTPVAIYARQGADIPNRLAMIRHYLAVQPDSVKIIVYDVDSHLFTEKGLSANSHRLFYPFMDIPVIREYLRENAVSAEEYWLRRYFKSPRFDEVTMGLSIRGWTKKWSNLKYGQVNIKRLKKELQQGNYRKISFDTKSISLFEETIRFVRSHDIHLILVYIPTIDLLNNAEPEKVDQSINFFKSFAAQDDGITFIDYNPKLSHRHEVFYDPIHLNPEGQNLLTNYLGSDLKKIIEKP